jgi:hypothetical protein
LAKQSSTQALRRLQRMRISAQGSADKSASTRSRLHRPESMEALTSLPPWGVEVSGPRKIGTGRVGGREVSGGQTAFLARCLLGWKVGSQPREVFTHSSYSSTPTGVIDNRLRRAVGQVGPGTGAAMLALVLMATQGAFGESRKPALNPYDHRSISSL